MHWIVFGDMYLKSFKNWLWERRKISLREWVIIVFLLGYWVVGFEFFLWSFKFIGSFPVVGDLLLERLWHFFFFALGMMLIFSNAIVSYTVQYQSPETSFLFSLPLSTRFIFYKQLIEGTIWSSWGFLFLAFPLILAFGIVFQSSFVYYLAAPVLVIFFVLIVSFLGSFLTHFFLKLNRGKNTVAAVLLFLLGVLVYLLRFPSELKQDSDVYILDFLKKFLEGLSFSMSPYLPSTWLAKGLLSISFSKWRVSLFSAGLMISTLLLLADLAYFISGKYYFPVWEKNQGGAVGKHRTFFWKVSSRFKIPTLIQKDMLCLIRDPSQWIQLGLMGAMGIFYITNLKNVKTYVENAQWENMIFFMNLAAISLILATLSLRFVFPQWSLEWRRSWIIGMAPRNLKEILRTKFLFPYFAFLILGEAASLISNLVLGSSLLRILLSFWMLGVISFVMISLSLSLGVLYPNFKSDHPSQIMSGLGGILNLVFSIVYLSVLLTVLSFPFHLAFLGKIHSNRILIFWVGGVVLFETLFSLSLSLGLLKIAERRPCLG
ncbi:MAG: hypothetical protein HYS07_01020 [Chlamydiae bacterium]|nr:hypothetical protein [Chlamydiota bacterium]MBI3276501.1 hypothetical protein [Chlamydiota bacterium]